VTTSSVNYINPPRANQNTIVKKKGSSIDTSPFLKESLIFDFESGKSASFSEDEDSFVFEEVPENKTSSLKPKDPKVADMAERLAGNLLSAVGATQLLLGEGGKTTSGSEPPMNGLELLKKGSELGSSRALYNLGVYYDRQRDFELARDYYKRAADIGHPIASYNYAAMILEKDPRMTPEVKLLMSYAYEHGVPEAKAYAT
jgi:TPR repeat protein